MWLGAGKHNSIVNPEVSSKRFQVLSSRTIAHNLIRPVHVGITVSNQPERTDCKLQTLLFNHSSDRNNSDATLVLHSGTSRSNICHISSHSMYKNPLCRYPVIDQPRTKEFAHGKEEISFSKEFSISVSRLTQELRTQIVAMKRSPNLPLGAASMLRPERTRTIRAEVT